jgi:uncharacterized Zn finger protein
MADSWWSQRFVQVLESYGLGGRMQRGRRYARTGQVLHLEVRPAMVTAQVQGSRRSPYRVFLELPTPTAEQWAVIGTALTSKVGFGAQLLAGQVPTELEAVFRDAGVDLFPGQWTDLRTECSCPDWGDPCKHIAAVLYVLADHLDADPWLLLEWRGRTREEILAPFQGAPPSPGDEVAPWWPFGQGAVARSERAPDDATFDLDFEAGPAGLVLDRLEEIDLQVAGKPLREALQPAYEQLSDPRPSPPDAPAERPTPRRPRPSRPPRR